MTHQFGSLIEHGGKVRLPILHVPLFASIANSFCCDLILLRPLRAVSRHYVEYNPEHIGRCCSLPGFYARSVCGDCGGI